VFFLKIIISRRNDTVKSTNVHALSRDWLPNGFTQRWESNRTRTGLEPMSRTEPNIAICLFLSVLSVVITHYFSANFHFRSHTRQAGYLLLKHRILYRVSTVTISRSINLYSTNAVHTNAIVLFCIVCTVSSVVLYRAYRVQTQYYYPRRLCWLAWV